MKTIKTLLILMISLVYSAASFAQGTFKTKNVIVITLDGLRWQEIFTGADSSLINNKEITKTLEPTKKKYWNPTKAVSE